MKFGRSSRLGCLFVALLCLLVAVPAFAETVSVTIGVGETTALVTGSTSPGASVTILDGGSVVGSTVANAAGDYSQVLTNQTPGLHTYQLYARDIAGRLTDTVSISVNIVEHAQTQITVFLPPTMQISESEVTQGTNVTVVGSAPANASVVLHIDDTFVVITADSTGVWQYVISTQTLQVGEHQIYAVATKSGGAQSYSTNVRTLIVNAPPSQTVPGVPTPPSQQPTVPSVGSPQSGTTVTSNQVTLTGTAEPGARIEIWNRGQLIGSTFADAQGRWSITITLTEFANEIKVRACRNNVCSPFSAGIMIYLAQPAVPPLLLVLNRHHIQTTVDQKVNLKATFSGGNPPYIITVDWGDGTKETIKSAVSPTVLTTTFKRAGQFNGTVTVADANGRKNSVAFATQVVAAPMKLLSLWPLAATGVAAAAFIFLGYHFFMWTGLRLRWRFWAGRK